MNLFLPIALCGCLVPLGAGGAHGSLSERVVAPPPPPAKESVRRASRPAIAGLITGSAHADATPPTAPSAGVRASTDDGVGTEAATASAKSASDHGLFGPARVGVLAGAGLSTRPLSLAALGRVHRAFAIGAEYKILPSVQESNVSAHAYAVGADFRWFPGHGALYVGTALGYQSLSATATGSQVIEGHTYYGYVAESVSSLYVTPRVGWLWTWDSGLALGVDLGVTIPIAASLSAVTGPGAESGMGASQIHDALTTFGKVPLPEINLLRVGFLL